MIALTGAYGELCLRRVDGRWLLAFFDAGNYRIDVLNLEEPPSNLYEAARDTVLHGVAWDREDHAGGHVAQLYSSYIVPGSMLDDLHLVVSQWNTKKDWPYRAMQFAGSAPRAGQGAVHRTPCAQVEEGVEALPRPAAQGVGSGSSGGHRSSILRTAWELTLRWLRH